MGYPGGAAIDARAARGNPSAIALPRPMLNKPGANFSFSGLKTAVAQWFEREAPLSESELDDLCASFQEAACEVLATKAVRAATKRGARRLVISGGVACNSRLRALARERGAKAGVEVTVPPAALCTDNAAMIGVAGYSRLRARYAAGAGFEEHRLDAVATWPLGRPAPARKPAVRPT